MSKFNLKRLESLGLVVAMTVTLGSCAKKSEASKYNFKPVLGSSFKNSFNTLGMMATDELNKIQKEALETLKREEAEITVEDVLKAFENSEYNDNTRLLVKDILDYGVPNDVLKNFLTAAKGDSKTLNSILSFGQSPFPFSYDSNCFDKVVNNRDLQIFDNRKEVIPSLPSTYLEFIKVNEYENFNVYSSFNLCGRDNNGYYLITDKDNRIIAHTNDGYVEVEGKKFQLTNFNWKLKKLGLESKARKDYSIAELMDIQFSISKIFLGYQDSTSVSAARIKVFDTTKCLISDKINGRNPYYFLEYVGADVFNEGGYFFRDILNKNAIVYFNQNNVYFCYVDLTKKYDEYFYEHTGEYIYEAPLCIDSNSFALNQIYFSGINDFLASKNYPDLIQSDYVSVQSIAKISSQVTSDFLAEIIGIQSSRLAI